MQRVLLAIGIVLFFGIAPSRAEIFTVTLSGANEIPPIVSPGSGVAVVVLDSATHQMRLTTAFGGLTTGTVAAHIHCCIAQPGNAGVATTLPSFAGFPLGVTSGTFDRVYDTTLASTWSPVFIAANGGTPLGAESALLTGALAVRAYLNIHTVMFPGGEIRGNLVQFTSPAESRGLQIAISDSIGYTFDQVSHRLDSLRSVRRDPYTSGIRGSFWLKGFGAWSRQGLDDGVAGYKSDGWGVAVGTDHEFAEGVVAGAAVSYSSTSLDYRNHLLGSSDDVSSAQLTLYATWQLDTFYLDAMAAYARQDYDRSRNTGFAGIATADTDGNAWGVRVGGGIPLPFTSLAWITPQAHLDWFHIDQHGYAESGGGLLSLAVAPESVDMLRSSLGARFDIVMDMGGLGVRPFARAFWRHDFEEESIDTTAQFLLGGPIFVTQGQELDRDTFTVGGGVNIYGGQSLSVGLGYDVTLGDSYTSHVAQAKLRFMF